MWCHYDNRVRQLRLILYQCQNNIFSWLMQIDSKVLKVMRKRTFRTSLQVNQYQFLKNVQSMESWDRYKDAHKQALLMWQESKKAKISGVVVPKTLTIFHIVRTVNLTRLALRSDYEVNNATVREYSEHGKSD